MPDTITCEHCGTVSPKLKAQQIVVDGRVYFFCSERCKIEWGELGEIEEED